MAEYKPFTVVGDHPGAPFAQAVLEHALRGVAMNRLMNDVLTEVVMYGNPQGDEKARIMAALKADGGAR